jgi:hypothetical protein
MQATVFAWPLLQAMNNALETSSHLMFWCIFMYFFSRTQDPPRAKEQNLDIFLFGNIIVLTNQFFLQE